MKNLPRLVRDTRGQDLVEYAWMAAFVASAATAVVPGMASALWTGATARQEVVLRVVGGLLAVVSIWVIVHRRRQYEGGNDE